jgi:hypothetical protein
MTGPAEQLGSQLLLWELEGGVPAWQALLARRGGPQATDWTWCREIFLPRLLTQGDELLYGGGEQSRLRGDLARALAILSFAPGGVRFGPRHWQGGRDA